MSQHLTSLEQLVASGGLSPDPRVAVAVGRVVGRTEDGSPLVDFNGNTGGPHVARCVASVSPDILAEGDREVLLNFEGGDASRPIVTAILRPTGLAPSPTQANSSSGAASGMTALVDGQRIRIEGKDEIVLACGEASITLRRNGKVIIRGTHLESDSMGANWIRGADIQVG